MEHADNDASDRDLEDVLSDESVTLVADDDGPSLSSLRPRREPIVVVTLLKTLGVASGVLAVLLGIGTIVLVTVAEVDRTWVWIGALGGVLIIFLGVIFALSQVALAHLVDTTHQALRHLRDLNAPGRLGGGPGEDALFEQVALMRDIRDAARLTDVEKETLARRRTQANVRKLVETIDTHLVKRDFTAAHEAVADLVEQYPEASETKRIADRVREIENASRQETIAELEENIRAYQSAASWEQAMALADEFIKTFPDEPRAAGLREEVRAGFEAATADQRREMYDRITDLARETKWREAFDITSDLIEQFPDSDEAEKLRPRLGALSRKAEVGERARLAAQVKDHMAGARWTEAYRAARELVDAYPDSDEAADVFGDIARLRRLARRS